MKKLIIRKRVLSLLISTHLLLTGCSIASETKIKKENQSDLSYKQSTLTKNSNLESSIDEKLENESSIQQESITIDISIEESSKEIKPSKPNYDVYITHYENKIEYSEPISIPVNEDASIEESSEISEDVSIEESSEITEDVSIEESSEISKETSIEESSKIAEETSIEESSEITEETSIEKSNEISEDANTEESSNNKLSQEEDYINEEIYTNDSKTLEVLVYANLREKPNPQGKQLKLLYPGDKLEKIGYVGEYCIVKYGENNAYVATDYVKEIENNKNDIKEDLVMTDLCYFIKDSTLYSDKELTKKIKDIPALESAEIYSKENNVYYIETEGNKGYVSKSSLSIISQPALVVDESEQYTYYYNNNSIMMEFPVVTGGLYTLTTKGLSEIYRVSYDATLVGSTWETYVGVFMPFTVYGEGFHDAWWRDESDFIPKKDENGNIEYTYEYNGSHGCVNMRTDDAFTLAKEVDKSMKSGKKVKVLFKR